MEHPIRSQPCAAPPTALAHTVPRAGSVGHDSTIEGGNAYPLPPGWSHGEEVTVIGFDAGYVRVGREPLGYNPDDRRDDHAPLRMAAIRVFELNLCPSLRLILVQDRYPNGIAPSWQKAPENLRASSRMSERRLWSEFFESNSVRHAHQWRCTNFIISPRTSIVMRS